MSKTSEYTPDHVRQRVRRAEQDREAKRAARRARKSSPRRQARILQDAGPVITLALVHREETLEGKQAAWMKLHRSETLRTYFKRFSYDEAKQTAVGRGGFILRDLPFVIAQQIERELSPLWMRGSLKEEPPLPKGWTPKS